MKRTGKFLDLGAAHNEVLPWSDPNSRFFEIWNACGPVEHCVDCVRGFINAGVDHVTIRPIGEDLNEQFRIYLEKVLPALKSVAANVA